MGSEQSMTQTIIQTVIKAAKAAIIEVRDSKPPTNTTRPAPVIPKNSLSSTEAGLVQMEIPS